MAKLIKSVFGPLVKILVCLTLLPTIYCHESSGLTIEVPNGQETCFFEDFEGNKKYLFEYKVLRGGNFDVDVTIESPSGMDIYNEARKTSDSFAFDISWGSFKFCFNNEFSMVSHKIIYFELRPEEHKRLAVEGGKKGPSANTQAEESTETVHSLATLIMSYQQKYRLEESRGRYEAERLNRHVQFYSILQAIIIVVVGIGEIFILRTFFSEPRHHLKDSSVTTLRP